MLGGSPKRKRNRTTDEEDEKERKKREEEQKIQEKLDIIRLGFENFEANKHISSHALQSNEFQLKNIMNEIAAANALKINQSNKLSEMLTGEESTISVILHATTKSISAQASETGMLYSKIAELEQEQKNIKEMTDFHELETDSLNYKIDQLVSDRDILKERVHVIQSKLNYANILFQEIESLEEVATQKKMEATNNLNAFKNSIRQVEGFEHQYMKDLQQQQAEERKNLKDANLATSKAMIQLDEAHKINEELVKKMHQLHQKTEAFAQLKQNTADILQTIQLLDKLEKIAVEATTHDSKQAVINLMPVEVLTDLSHVPVTRRFGRTASLKPQLLIKISTLQAFSRQASKKRSSVAQSPTEDTQEAATRNTYIFHIGQFYRKHQDGPDAVADKIIEAYQHLLYKEGSLQMTYKELGNLMVSKEKELDLNQKQLQKLALAEGKEQAIKEIPEEIESPVITARSRSRTVGQSMTKLEAKSFRVADDSSPRLVKVRIAFSESKASTERNRSSPRSTQDFSARNIPSIEELSKLDTLEQTQPTPTRYSLEELKKKAENQISFVIKLYISLIELIYRMSKLLLHLSDVAISHFPSDLDRFANDLLNNISDIRGVKRTPGSLNEQSNLSPVANSRAMVSSPSRHDSHYSFENAMNNRDLALFRDDRSSIAGGLLAKDIILTNLSSADVINIFMAQFNCNKEVAKSFANNVKMDLYIQGFVTPDELTNYLSICYESSYYDGEPIKKAFQNFNALQSKGVKNLQGKFQNLYRLLAELYAKVQDTSNEALSSLPEETKERVQGNLRLAVSHSEFVRKAQEKTALKICRYFDYSHPMINHLVKTDKAKLQAIFQKEQDDELKKKKDTNTLINELSAHIQEKNRGYFYKKIDYPQHRPGSKMEQKVVESPIPKNEDEFMEFERVKIKENCLAALAADEQAGENKNEQPKENVLSHSTTPTTISKKYLADPDKIKLIRDSMMMKKVRSIENFVKSESHRLHIPKIVDDLIPFSVRSARKELRLQRITDSEPIIRNMEFRLTATSTNGKRSNSSKNEFRVTSSSQMKQKKQTELNNEATPDSPADNKTTRHGTGHSKRLFSSHSSERPRPLSIEVEDVPRTTKRKVPIIRSSSRGSTKNSRLNYPVFETLNRQLGSLTSRFADVNDFSPNYPLSALTDRGDDKKFSLLVAKYTNL